MYMDINGSLVLYLFMNLANVGKDASAAFARACGIFVIYLTTCANDYAREQKRQTITANDVLAAVKELDFDEFTPQLEAFLAQYRADEHRKKDAKAKYKAAQSIAKEEASAGAGAANVKDTSDSADVKMSAAEVTESTDNAMQVDSTVKNDVKADKEVSEAVGVNENTTQSKDEMKSTQSNDAKKLKIEDDDAIIP